MAVGAIAFITPSPPPCATPTNIFSPCVFFTTGLGIFLHAISDVVTLADAILMVLGHNTTWVHMLHVHNIGQARQRAAAAIVAFSHAHFHLEMVRISKADAVMRPSPTFNAIIDSLTKSIKFLDDEAEKVAA